MNVSALISAILTFVIGGSVFLKDRKHRVFTTFSVFCFNLCFWYLSKFFATTLHSDALIWINLVIAVAIPVNAERFFRAFLAEDPRRPEPMSRSVLGGILSTLLLLYSGLFTPIHHHPLLIIPLCLFVFGSLYHCMFLIYARHRAMRPRPEATRLIYLFYGGVAAITLAATDFLPQAGEAFPTIGHILTVLYMYFISQTLFHFRLLDIKELLGKMVTLSVLVLTLTIIYGLLLVWVGGGRPGVFFFNTIVASFVILVIFDQMRTWVEDRVNRWMFREKYEFSRRLQLLRQELANIIEAPALVSQILGSFEASERVTHVSIYLSDPTGASFRLTGHVGPPPIEHLEGPTRHLFLERLKESGLLSREALERQLDAQNADGQEDAAVATRNIMATMEDCLSSVCIPLIVDNQILGFLNLRDDRLREAYASDEMNELRKLAAQAAITLRNSQLYEQMKERDRLAALGQMAAGLAHEIRNPLGAIKGAAQLMKSTRPDKNSDCEAEAGEYVGIIVEEVNRLNRVVSQFLGYARPDRGERQVLGINDIVHKTMQLLRSQIDDSAKVETDLAPELPSVRADPEQLKQVFLNLGLNGLQAMGPGGRLSVFTGTRQGSRGGKGISLIEITFKDTGEGIPKENLSDIFIPFFTTKEKGTGLGLPICQRIIEGHGGSIEVRSQTGRGSTFSVLLPLAEDLTGKQTNQTALDTSKPSPPSFDA